MTRVSIAAAACAFAAVCASVSPTMAGEPPSQIAPQPLRPDLPISYAWTVCQALRPAAASLSDDARKDATSCPVVSRSITTCTAPHPGAEVPSFGALKASLMAVTQATKDHLLCPSEDDVQTAQLSATAAGAGDLGSLAWQDNLVRGLAGFVTARLEAELGSALEERVKDEICKNDDAKAILHHTCDLLQNKDAGALTPSSWGTAKAALEADLKDFPYNFLDVELGSHISVSADAKTVLLAAVQVVRSIESGNNALETLASLRPSVGADICGEVGAPCYLYVLGTVAQIVGTDLANPIDSASKEAYAKLALQKLQSEPSINKAISSFDKTTDHLSARVDAVWSLRKHLEKLYRQEARAAKSPTDVTVYSQYVRAFSPVFSDAAQVLTGDSTKGTCATGGQFVGCLAAASEVANDVADMLDAVRAKDYSTAAVVAFSIPQSLNTSASLPTWSSKYLPFLAELASAKDSDSVQKVIDNAASPVGSYRAKRGYRPGNDFTLTVTALAGAQGGNEWIL